jgi:hypothetical protein
MSVTLDLEWLPLEKHMIAGLKPGDVLRRWKTGVWHLGIYLGEGQVLHNVPGPGGGERMAPLHSFAAGQELQVARGNPKQRQEVMRRASAILTHPRSYSYVWRNCEHTAYEILEGAARSPTVQRTSTAVALAAVAVLAGSAWLFRRQFGRGLRRLR